MTGPLLAPDALVARFRAEGERRYHDHHPFHVRMHAGELSKDELRSWVVNRFYYQTRIPIKDALILSKSDDPAFRRASPGARAGPAGRPGCTTRRHNAGN